MSGSPTFVPAADREPWACVVPAAAGFDPACLERVITCNLSCVSRILRVLRFHARDLNLKPSFTVYNRHGKGPKQRLCFSKTVDLNLEKAYATHLIQ